MASVPLTLGLLAPDLPGVPDGAFLLPALVAWAATAPMLPVTTGAACWIALQRGPAPAFFAVTGLIAAVGLAAFPQVLGSIDRVPLIGGPAPALEGPAQLLASASPALILLEAVRSPLAPGLPDTRLRLPAGWSPGLPDRGVGLVMQVLLALPLAWLFRRAGADGGEASPKPASSRPSRRGR